MLKQINMKIPLSLFMASALSVGANKPMADVVYLDQGWTDENNFRDISYNLTQGSQLIPYEIFMGLEVQENKDKLHSVKVMDTLRFLPSYDASPHNPDKLAVGFVKDIDKTGKEWIGLTCAACHTGQIDVNGVSIRLDGAPAMADFIGFLETTQKSLAATHDDKNKLKRLAKKMYRKDWKNNLTSLKSELQKYDEKLQGIIYRDSGPTQQGHGRVDAFGSIGNQIFVDDLKNENNFKVSNAPVSYPVLWDTPQLENVQWTGNVQNPLGRNYGEVLGTFGKLDLTNPGTFLENSVKVTNIFHLEEMLRVLKSPQWPSQYFGELDAEKVEEGKTLYTQIGESGYACVSCHTLKDETGNYPLTPAQENAFGKQFIKTILTPVAEIGTDSSAADAIYQPFIVDVGPIIASIVGTQYLPRTDIQSIIVSLGLRQAFTELELTQAEIYAYIGYRVYAPGYDEPMDIYSYKARPLNGVWASSPYLHNASVRTLRDLLNTESKREKTFYTGTRKFDTEQVGFKSIQNEEAQEFDVSLDGNHNTGHNYGTYFTPEQKDALVEYLKSL